MEPERTRLALVYESSVAINQEETVGPSRIGLLGCVIQAVDDGGEFDAQFAHAAVGEIRAVVKAARTGEDNVILHVTLHLPDVAGVCFQDVHGVERDVVAILLVQLVEGGNLPPEGRSGVTAENEHHRLLAAEGGKAHVTALILGG